jgi:hypothetical protein
VEGEAVEDTVFAGVVPRVHQPLNLVNDELSSTTMHWTLWYFSICHSIHKTKLIKQYGCRAKGLQFNVSHFYLQFPQYLSITGNSHTPASLPFRILDIFGILKKKTNFGILESWDFTLGECVDSRRIFTNCFSPQLGLMQMGWMEGLVCKNSRMPFHWLGFNS